MFFLPTIAWNRIHNKKSNGIEQEHNVLKKHDAEHLASPLYVSISQKKNHSSVCCQRFGQPVMAQNRK